MSDTLYDRWVTGLLRRPHVVKSRYGHGWTASTARLSVWRDTWREAHDWLDEQVRRAG